jgi:hypothetical protein
LHVQARTIETRPSCGVSIPISGAGPFACAAALDDQKSRPAAIRATTKEPPASHKALRRELWDLVVRLFIAISFSN